MWTWLVPSDPLLLLLAFLNQCLCTLATYFLPVAAFVYLTERTWRRRGLVDDVTRRAVLVTGCDSGFGFGLARHLDSLGVPVYAACLTEAGREKLREACSERVTSLLMDVTNTDDIQRVYASVCEHMARVNDGRYLWGVVNNAGILGDFGTTEMYTKADFTKVMDVNFFGQVEVVRTFLPLLKQSKGRIVNIASISGVFPYASLGFPCPYTPSKYAVVGYTDALRQDLRKWGISVSLLLPGGHSTDIMSIDGQVARFRAMWGRLDSRTRAEYGENWIEEVCTEYRKMESVIASLPGVEPVVEAYTDALLAQRPHCRYVIGADAKVMNVIKLLPQRVIDMLLSGPLRMLPLPPPAALLGQSARATSAGNDVMARLGDFLWPNPGACPSSTGVLGGGIL